MELHIVFNYSAAGSLRHALAEQNIAFARFSDDLSYGPINPPEPGQRREWIEEQLGFDNPDITSDEESFWPQILDKCASRVAWISRRSAAEYCGFLEYLRRLGGLPTHVIDTTDVKDQDGAFFRSTGSIPTGRIPGLNLPAALNSETQVAYLDLWHRLRAENNDLRIVDRNLALQSAPLSFFDGALLSLGTMDWQPMQRIVGEFLVANDVNDLLAFARLYSLVDAGLLETRETGRPHPDVRLVQL